MLSNTIRFFAILLVFCGSFWLGAYGGMAILFALYGAPRLVLPLEVAVPAGLAVILFGEWLVGMSRKDFIMAFLQQLLWAAAIAIVIACAGMDAFHFIGQGMTFVMWRPFDQALFIFLCALFPVAVVIRKIIDIYSYISRYHWR